MRSRIRHVISISLIHQTILFVNLSHRPSSLEANRLRQLDKYGKHHFHVSKYALAHDLLSGDSRLRTVTAHFCGKAFHEAAYFIDTTMSIMKSMLLRKLPKEGLRTTADLYFEKHMSLTMDGNLVNDDEMLGLCTWKGTKVASVDEKEKIIIQVDVNEGKTGGSSAGSNSVTGTDANDSATNSKEG